MKYRVWNETLGEYAEEDNVLMFPDGEIVGLNNCGEIEAYGFKQKYTIERGAEYVDEFGVQLFEGDTISFKGHAKRERGNIAFENGKFVIKQDGKNYAHPLFDKFEHKGYKWEPQIRRIGIVHRK